ncbi:formin-like protein 20 [Dendroctonus ponderosae]
MYRFSLLSVCVIVCYLSADAASIQKRHAQSSDLAAAILERPGLLNLATRLHNIAGSILDRAQQNRPNHGFGPPPPGPPGHYPPHPGFQGHYPPPPPPPPPHGGYPDWFGGHGYPGYGPPGFGPPGGPPPPGGPGWPPPEYGPPPPPPPPYDPYGPYHGGNFPQPQPEDEDKKLISGYFDGNFPVILLDQENEVRR